MKNINFSASEGYETNIFITSDESFEDFNNFSEMYSTLTILDSKLRNTLKFQKSAKFIRGGEEAKFLDKYLDIIEEIKKNEYHNILCAGGGAVLDVSGYSFFTLNFNKKNLIMYPSTFSSMILLPLTGNFYMDLNYKTNYLGVKGNPGKIIINTNFLKTLPISVLKNQFFSAYFVSKYMEKRYSELTVNYIKNFKNIDMEDYLYNFSSFFVSLISGYESVPGINLTDVIIRNTRIIDFDYLKIYMYSYLIMLFISQLHGFFYDIDGEIDTIKIFGLFDRNYFKQIYKNLSITIPFSELIITKNGFQLCEVTPELLEKAVKKLENYLG